MSAVKRPWTAREVRQLIADHPLRTPRYELVDGELLVTPSPNRAHQLAISQMLGVLEDYLRDSSIGRALHSPSDVELEPETVTLPDVFVVPVAEWTRLASNGPARQLLVVVEARSPSSGRYDSGAKRALYQRHVSEYWIVDLDARLVERWQPNDTRPEILIESLEWSPSGAAEPFRLELPGYFASAFDER